jgi:copper chaperone
MPQEIFFAQNIKCNGCVARVREGLLGISGIESVAVDIPTGRVTVTAVATTRPVIHAKLAELGYPEKSS